MQRPIIFVATTDPHFGLTATDAVLESSHGLRRVHNFAEASFRLGQGTSDIALAIVDVDFDHRGGELLRILGSCEPDFPILAVARTADQLKNDESIASIAVDALLKPVSVEELRSVIRDLCNQSAVPHYDHSRLQTLQAQLCGAT